VAGSSTLLLGSTTSPSVTAGGPVDVDMEDPLASLTQPTNPNPSAVPKVDFGLLDCTRTIIPAAGRIDTVNVVGGSTVTLHGSTAWST
jgi:hypothetical protein